jgi:hypothetical protein
MDNTTDDRADQSNQLLTLPEVAARLRVPINTVLWWRQQGSGPTFFKVGRRLVTTADELHGWIQAQEDVAQAGARMASESSSAIARRRTWDRSDVPLM